MEVISILMWVTSNLVTPNTDKVWKEVILIDFLKILIILCLKIPFGKCMWVMIGFDCVIFTAIGILGISGLGRLGQSLNVMTWLYLSLCIVVVVGCCCCVVVVMLY